MQKSKVGGILGLPRGIALAAAMAAAPRRIQLDEGKSAHFFLGGQLSGPGTAGRSIEQFARHIEARHAWFGKVELDDKTFQSFIKNFNDNVYGQDIQGDKNHNPGQGVMFKIERLFTEGDKLCGEVSWTQAGVECFEKDGFKYFSIDFTDDYLHPETGKNHGPLLFGVAMTPRPFIKHMTPTQGPGRMVLSEGRSVVYPDYLHITKDADMKLAEFLKGLQKKLAEKKLSATIIGVILSAFEAQAKALSIGDDGEKLQALADAQEPQWNQLAEAAPAPGGAQLSQQQISDLVSQSVRTALDDRAAQERQQADKQTANRKAFTDLVNAAKGLSDDTKTVLLKQAEVITGNMTSEQVTQLANSALQLGNELEVQRKRAALGMQFGGQGLIGGGAVILGDGVGSQLHGLMRERLLLSDEYSQGRLSLPEEKKLSGFAQKILGHFDHIHGARLEAEAKRLANDGSTNVADGQFPAAVQRQVIVELLADLKFLNIIQTISDPQAQAMTQIPYEQRNVAAIHGGAIVYEGQGIKKAGVKQAMWNAYITPRKIAMLISDEMIHFSRVSQISWDAWARNIASNSRLMRDIICAAVANEMQRSADAYGATAISNQAFTSQVNGTRTLFKTTSWPIVRPKTNRDLQGTQIGNVENPISMVVDGNNIPEYNGTGTQANGNYFQIVNYNLGYFRIVNQAGVLQTLTNGLVSTITYSAANNVTKFDIDNGSVEYPKHLNGLLNAIGRRKAVLLQQRFVQANFGICSNTLHQTITEAEQFEDSHTKPGNGMDGNGDLSQVKGMPIWGTNQPGVDLGDERILLGERGTCSYSVAKPFVTGQPFEVVNDQGEPTGEKQAYGTEFSSIVVPDPIRDRMTSVIVYSATARAAV